MTELGEVEKTSRGFQIIKFNDRYDNPCYLQQSSLADYMQPGSSAVWLGLQSASMHLDRDQVELLVEVLNHWLETGEFNAPD